jgi:hypothetical protein
MSETPAAHHYSQKKPKGKTAAGPRMPLLPPQDFADNERPLPPANSNSTVGVFEQKMEANMGHLDEELQKNPEMDVEKVRAAVVLESMFESLGDLRSSFLLSPKVTNDDGSPKDKRFLYAIQAPDGQWFWPETSGITVGYQYTDQMHIGSDDGMVYFRAMFPAASIPGGESLPLASEDEHGNKIVYVNARINPKDVDPASWQNWAQRLSSNAFVARPAQQPHLTQQRSTEELTEEEARGEERP